MRWRRPVINGTIVEDFTVRTERDPRNAMRSVVPRPGSRVIAGASGAPRGENRRHGRQRPRYRIGDSSIIYLMRS